MQRVLSGVIVAGLTAGTLVGVSGGIAGAQTPGLAAFCQARVDAEAAAQSSGKTAQAAFDDALTRILTNAPPPILAQATTVVNAIKAKGPEKAFADPTVAAADVALSAYVAGNCGYAVVKVTATDYQFTGLPATVKAGNTVIQMTNTAPAEEHVMVIMRRKAGVTDSAAKLLALSEKKLGKKVDPIGGTNPAGPGASAYTILKLDPGKYIATCYLPQGGKKNGKPHFKLGMTSEFTVS